MSRTGSPRKVRATAFCATLMSSRATACWKGRPTTGPRRSAAARFNHRNRRSRLTKKAAMGSSSRARTMTLALSSWRRNRIGGEGSAPSRHWGRTTGWARLSDHFCSAAARLDPSRSSTSGVPAALRAVSRIAGLRPLGLRVSTCRPFASSSLSRKTVRNHIRESFVRRCSLPTGGHRQRTIGAIIDQPGSGGLPARDRSLA